MYIDENYVLNDGRPIPKIAFGTWMIGDGEIDGAIAAAIGAGYRHIDTAEAYGNEKGVGRALALYGKGKEIFLTTKIPAETKTVSGAKASVEQSLKSLGREIDLLLIHAPKPWELLHDPSAPDYNAENLAVWDVMQSYVRAGDVKSIGVSNFRPDEIENLINNSPVVPAVNQISVFIGHTPKETIDYCRGKGILVEAHSPNSHGRLASSAFAKRYADKYGVPVPVLSVAYCLATGLLPIPKSVDPAHIAQNAHADVDFTPEDLDALINAPEF